MSIRNRILIVNAGILGGLVFEYFQGAPALIIAAVGLLLLLFANAIIFFRSKKSNQPQ